MLDEVGDWRIIKRVKETPPIVPVMEAPFAVEVCQWHATGLDWGLQGVFSTIEDAQDYIREQMKEPEVIETFRKNSNGL